jgi:CRP-like cAMP-binding protein
METADVRSSDTRTFPAYERHTDVSLSSGRGRQREGGQSRFVMLETLTPEDAEQVVSRGETREVPAGEKLIEQWDASQDFFLIREGKVEVLVDGEKVAELGPDEFFGEIAALDWGAGFGYPRIAEVVATTPLSLLVYPDGQLQELVADFPAVERVIRAAVEYRLSVR